MSTVVVTKEGLPIGEVPDRAVLEKCIVKGLDSTKVTAEDLMSTPLVTIEPEARLGEAKGLCLKGKIRRIFFMVEKGKIIGSRTQTGICMNIPNIARALQAL